MVTEKVTAAIEGWRKGSASTARIVSARLKRRARLEAGNDLMDIAEAMTRPARRRVKSNAVRLTKV